jgi:4-amino-4-deoxy-L-arabinose transferase-like glycosyltransferase
MIVQITKPHHHWILLWAAIALLRVAYALLSVHIDPLLRRDPLYGDALYHDEMAWTLASEGRLEFEKGLMVAPAYIWLMGGLYWLFGHEPGWVRLLNGLLGVLTVWGVWQCARHLFSERVALWTLILTALHPQLLLISGWLYTENLVLPLIVWGIYWLWTAKTPRDYVLTGVLLGLLCLTRANFLPFLLLATLWLLWAHRKQKPLLPAATLLLTACLLTAPYIFYLYQRFDRFVPVAAGGYVFFWANNPYADGGFVPHLPVEMKIGNQIINRRDFARAQNPVDRDRNYMRLGLLWIREQPGDFMRLLWQKTKLSLSALGLQNPQNRGLVAMLMLLDVGYWLYLLVAHFGAVYGCRAQIRERSLLFGLYALTWLLIWAYAGGTRTLLPVAPFLGMFFIAGVYALRERPGQTQRAQRR